MKVGAGFDAETVATVDLELKRRVGWLAYVVAMLGVARRFDAPCYRVTVDGRGHEAASVIVTRGRHYGGPFLLARDADLRRPELHACLFEHGGLWHSIRYGLALLIGLLPRLSGFRVVSGKMVTIDGPAGARLQGDGDLIGELPARVELSPKPLMLLLPAAAARA
jgi:diacylglycerol kinase family enzyme